jgi:hypothetical protein
LSSVGLRQLACLALLGCGVASLLACHKKATPCRQDSDCPAPEVCFADGCGDPGHDIRVEVSPQSAAGRFAQDLALDDIHARQDLAASFPAVLQGSINFLSDAPPRQVVPYSGAIAIRGQGESEIIPGVVRTFEVTIALPQEGNGDGLFSLPMSAGLYSITANTLPSAMDPGDPPATTQARTAVRPGSISNVDFLLGALRPTYDVQITAPTVPSGLDVQAFSDPVNLRPFSQRVPAGNPAGGFTLHLSPSVLLNRSFIVQVSPRDPTAIVPQKIFGPILATPSPPSLNLDLGDYGEPVVVTGRIVDSHGGGIPSATVYVDGRVGGGGTFRSQGVQTDAVGNFSLSTLRSAADSSSTFWAIPPTQSSSGILRLPLAIRGPSSILLGSVACPDKVIVQGRIYQADGSNAPGVRVIAVPIGPLNGLPLPGNGGQDVTDGDSSFSLKLDPAIYRLDFIPGGQLPRVSRFASVSADPNPFGPGFRQVQLEDSALSKGRRITGSVLAIMSQDGTHTIAPFTSLRFFRLINDYFGRPSSVLLAETVSDARGMYFVNLPSRE